MADKDTKEEAKPSDASADAPAGTAYVDTGVSSESVVGSQAQILEADAQRIQAEAEGTKPANAQVAAKVDAKGDKGEALKKALAKAAGVKPENVTGFNEERQTIVTEYGGKYRLAPDGKSVITLAGPVPEEK